MTSNDETKSVVIDFADGKYANKTEVLKALDEAEMGNAPKYSSFSKSMRKIANAVDVIDNIAFTDSKSFQNSGWNDSSYEKAENSIDEIIRKLESKKNEIASLKNKDTLFDMTGVNAE